MKSELIFKLKVYPNQNCIPKLKSVSILIHELYSHNKVDYQMQSVHTRKAHLQA